MVNKSFITLTLTLFLGTACMAQIEGRWLVTQVTVGNEELTPISKWFQFDGDNQLISGNGGVVNTRGAWQFDENQQTLLFFNDAGEEDEYGGFNINWDGDLMTWNREEDGMPVSVYLEQTDQIPLAPWDEMIGLWKRKDQKGTDLTLGPIETILLRWDRVFAITEVNNNEKHFGVWHINGHRPELSLLSGKGDAFDAKWDFKFDGPDTMIWSSKENEMEIVFNKTK